MKAADTTILAWKMAIKNRPVTQHLLFHSDRGVQYACSDFREHLKGLPVLQSMSRKGNEPKMHDLIGRSVGIMQ